MLAEFNFMPKDAIVSAVVRICNREALDKFLSTSGRNVKIFEKLGLAVGDLTIGELENETNSMDFIDLDQIIQVNPIEHVVASDQLSEGNWAIEYYGMPDIWKTTKGEGVTVAVLDSGIDGSHPCLVDSLSGKYVVTDDLGDASIIDGTPSDSGYHGTHVASIIAGKEVDGIPAGVAPAAKITSVQILSGSTGTIRRALAGLEEVAKLSDVKIVNLSFELVGQSGVFAEALKTLTTLGKIVVVAAGNGGLGKEASPGNYPRSFCISVGASTRDDKIWSYSNGKTSHWNKEPFPNTRVNVPTISAPGKEIIAAYPGGLYKMLSGTSMATPHVSGACALMASMKHDLNLEGMQKALISASKDLGGNAWDPRYGEGIVNIQATLAVLNSKLPFSSTLFRR